MNGPGGGKKIEDVRWETGWTRLRGTRRRQQEHGLVEFSGFEPLNPLNSAHPRSYSAHPRRAMVV